MQDHDIFGTFAGVTPLFSATRSFVSETDTPTTSMGLTQQDSDEHHRLPLDSFPVLSLSIPCPQLIDEEPLRVSLHTVKEVGLHCRAEGYTFATPSAYRF